MKKTTNLQKMLVLLQDGQWHSSHELAFSVSYRFGHTVYEARKKGYSVEKRQVGHNEFEYRLKAV